jgi:hypothetical protein
MRSNVEHATIPVFAINFEEEFNIIRSSLDDKMQQLKSNELILLSSVLDEKYYEVYKKIFKHLTTVLNDNELAEAKYYALKLSLIFGDEKIIITYLKLHPQSEIAKTLSNLKIPSEKWNLSTFHNILKKKFAKDSLAMTNNIIPVMAKIEQKIKEDGGPDLNKCSNIDLKENLEKLCANFCYENVSVETEEDAVVFQRHNMSKESFAEWLELRKQAGNNDELIPPQNLLFDGATIGQKNKTILAMNHLDPRRAVLGYITSCCERLDSHTTKYHVIEDTKLKSVGIVIIAKGRPSKLSDENGHLSQKCKDDDIIGFLRICVTDDQKTLIIDTTAIRPVNTKTVKQRKDIAQLIAKFSENFLAKNSGFNEVWYGIGMAPHTSEIGRYFLRKNGSVQIRHPEGMDGYEGVDLHLVANRKENLYTDLIHSPHLIMSLTENDLIGYNLADILRLVLNSSEQDTTTLRKFTELVTEEQLRSINPIQLACLAENSDAIKFFINYENQDLIGFNAETWPNALSGICANLQSNEQRLELLESLFKNSDLDTRHRLLFPDGEINILNYIMKTKSEEIMMFVLSQCDELSLLKLLVTDDPNRTVLSTIIEKGMHKVLTYVLEKFKSDQNALVDLFTPMKNLTNEQIPIYSFKRGTNELESFLKNNYVTDHAKRALVLATHQNSDSFISMVTNFSICLVISVDENKYEEILNYLSAKYPNEHPIIVKHGNKVSLYGRENGGEWRDSYLGNIHELPLNLFEFPEPGSDPEYLGEFKAKLIQSKLKPLKFSFDQSSLTTRNILTVYYDNPFIIDYLFNTSFLSENNQRSLLKQQVNRPFSALEGNILHFYAEIISDDCLVNLQKLLQIQLDDNGSDLIDNMLYHRNSNHKTPLEVALEKNNIVVAKLLLSKMCKNMDSFLKFINESERNIYYLVDNMDNKTQAEWHNHLNDEATKNGPLTLMIMPLINDLTNYINTRSNASGVYNFFRNLNEMDQKTKVDAAKTLLYGIKYNKSIQFTALQTEALVQADSQLGKLVEKHLELLPMKMRTTFEQAKANLSSEKGPSPSRNL